jgi:NagD protein
MVKPMTENTIKNVICDIDGVLMHENQPIPGAAQFIQRILENNFPLVLLTNFPSQTQADLQHRLASAGIRVPEHCFYTSTMATAAFLQRQEGRRAYVIGEGALTHELYKIGFTITDIDPDFVIVGETRSFNWDMIQKASLFISHGARFIATNPDVGFPSIGPACGALCAPIERLTGKTPFYMGKPSTWMMRAAMDSINAHAENTVIVGDTLHTDILAGIQAGMATLLVLSGHTQAQDLDKVAYRPTFVFPSVAEIDIF